MQSSKTSQPSAKTTGRPLIHFSSEALLREAIRALLSRIPEVSLVQITHSSLEVGKDIVFYLAGGLGERMLCACVVKNASLSGKSAASQEGALTILHQVKQALLNPRKTEYGLEIPVQKVFVVTPYDMSEVALNTIFGHIKESIGRVEFVGGARLFDLFKRYWPDFFADEFTAVREYLRSTTAQLRLERPLQQVAINYRLGVPDQTIVRYYVQPNCHQELKAITFDPSLWRLAYNCFATVMESRNVPGKAKPKLVPVSPARVSVSAQDVEACQRNIEDGEMILKFLCDWGYCDDNACRAFIRELTGYHGFVYDLRQRHVATQLESFRVIGTKARSPSVPARLSSGETEQLLSKAAELSTNLHSLISQLKADLATVVGVIQAKTVNGIAALRDPRYKVAMKVQDMYEAAPVGLFIRQSDQVHEKKDSTSARQKTSFLQRRLDFPNNFLEIFPSSVLIVGAAGFGKTSFCRWHALHDAERFAKGISEWVPAYFALNEVGRGNLDSFEEVFLKHVGHSALLPANSEIGTQPSRKVRLYLDGLDEVPSSEMRQSIVRLVRRGVEKWSNVQIVLTARDYVVGTWLSWLPKFHLSAFTDNQLQELLANWLDKNATQVNMFNEQLARTPSLGRVLVVPLLATLVILVFRATRNLPSSRRRLYEIFVELLTTGWDLAKGVQRGSKFGPIVKLAVLRRIAYMAHDKRLKFFSQSFLRPIIKGSVRDATVGNRWAEILEELLQDGLLISTGGMCSFAHISFQEFLAASNLVGDPSSRRRTRVLREFLQEDNWWKEVLAFYLELSANTEQLHDWIAETRSKLPAKRQETALVQSRLLLAHLHSSFPDLAV